MIYFQKKNIKTFFRKYFFLVGLTLVMLFVGLAVAYKMSRDNSKIIYAKVKVSQGLWWVNTIQPNYWYAKGLKPGLIQKSLAGKPVAELLEVSYYPAQNTNEYNVYLTVKMKADYNARTSEYKFERDTLSIASPITFSFSEVFINGTVLAFSDKPFKDTHVTKIVTINKNIAETWEGEAISIGDSYSNGQEKILEILDKQIIDTYAEYNSYPIESAPRKNITVKIRMKLQQIDGKLIYGEEQILLPGRNFTIMTDNFRFQDFKIITIE